MASAAALILLAVFTTTASLLPLSSADKDDPLAPLLSPLIGDLCKGVGCGKGKCKTADSIDSAYECECDPGWKQILSPTSNSSAFKFLPCVIPNCTFHFSCSEAAPPAQSKETSRNTSVLDPCYWANCGGGVCNKTSALTFTCLCEDGYYNLLNNTAFPCFKECSIGGDCADLGIPMTNKSTASAPNLPDKSNTNQARSLQLKFFYGMIMLVIGSALLL